MDNKDITNRIDNVLKMNKILEYVFITLTVVLFSCGIICIISAIVVGKYLWSTPSAVTTSLLYFPLKEIKTLRWKNISLAITPTIIESLPRQEAVKELQKLLKSLNEGLGV